MYIILCCRFNSCEVMCHLSDNNVLHSSLQYSSQLLPSHYGILLQWFIIKFWQRDVYKRQLLKEMHDGARAGCLGNDETIGKIRKWLYYFHLYNDAEECCRAREI